MLQYELKTYARICSHLLQTACRQLAEPQVTACSSSGASAMPGFYSAQQESFLPAHLALAAVRQHMRRGRCALPVVVAELFLLFLCRFTAADLRLYPTIIRYDSVYTTLFKCSRRRVTDYPALTRWRKDVYNLRTASGGMQARRECNVCRNGK